jgi:7-carboxy-7-deazaguanine synthase
MRVTEIFCSLQGERILASTPSVFVRLAGCPLRCRWCDTTYAWDFRAGKDMEPAEIVEQVNRWPCKFVVLTGGEPMAGADFSARAGLADLTHHLRADGKHVTIETAGVLFVPGLACDLMSISPKLSNSAPYQAGPARGREATRLDLEALGGLIRAYPYQLKFVVESSQDICEIREVLGQLDDIDRERIMLMPQARTREDMLSRAAIVAELCKETGFRFGQRLHILLWDAQRRT